MMGISQVLSYLFNPVTKIVYMCKIVSRIINYERERRDWFYPLNDVKLV